MTTTDSHRRPNKPWRDVTDWDNGYDTAVKEYEPMLRETHVSDRAPHRAAKCEECERTWPCFTSVLSDRAEQRLRGGAR